MDSGTYTCEALNDAGTAKKTYNLDVYKPSEISNSDVTDEVVVNKGDRFVLLCDYSGYPYPTVQWLKNQRSLQNEIDKFVFKMFLLIKLNGKKIVNQKR